jgi:TatD DNase family protein
MVLFHYKNLWEVMVNYRKKNMFDTHCHLFDKPLDSVNTAMVAYESGLSGIAVVATTEDSWEQILAKKDEVKKILINSVFSLGIHPWFIDKALSQWESRLDSFSSNIDAIGEIGLDRGKRAPSIELQISGFEVQMEIARSRNIPVLIHAVKTHDLILEHCKNHPLSRGIIHSFSGSPSHAKSYMDKGWVLGVGGGIARENSHRLRRIISKIPLEFIVVETDSPYMGTPLGKPGFSSPSHIYSIVEKLAEIKNIDVQDVISITTKNALRVFAR